MKIATITGILVMFTCLLNAQQTYLKITFSNQKSLSYPPKTKFELVNNQGDTILTENQKPQKKLVDKDYILTIYPTYKQKTDVIKLSNSQVELVEITTMNTNHFGKWSSNGVEGKYTVSDSMKQNGKKNVVLTFSNGIVFTYTDGDVKAKLNNTELVIKGNYVIYSEIGIAKVSFSPKNGETWWVFEPK